MRNIGCCCVLLILLGAGAYAAIPPVLTLFVVPYAAKAPVVDGKLDDACWQTAPSYTTFYKYFDLKPTATPLQTAVQLCYDDHGLYVAGRMYEKNPDKIKATIRQRGDPDLWRDDCAEIYFSNTGSLVGYRKFTLNALATVQTTLSMDAANVDDTWSPEGWQVATSHDDKGWYFELCIPWANLGKTARDGDLWRFCLVRYSWSSGGWNGGGLVSSSLGGSHSNPDRFGWLLFTRNGAVDSASLTRDLPARVPGDWLLVLPGQAILKANNQATATSLAAMLATLRGQAQLQLEDCRKLVGADPATGKSCDEIGQRLAGLPANPADPIAFEQAVIAIGQVNTQLEDVKYTVLLHKLFDASGQPVSPAQLPAQ